MTLYALKDYYYFFSQYDTRITDCREEEKKKCGKGPLFPNKTTIFSESII